MTIRTANDNVHHLRSHSVYTPPPPDIEPAYVAREDAERANRRGTEMIGGWCLVSSAVLVIVALVWAVWL